MFEKIHNAIYELLLDNCQRENLIICYSQLAKRFIEKECYSLYAHTGMVSFSIFEGVVISEDWPYNEIVVYDKLHVSYYPHLIRKIEIKFNSDRNVKECDATEAK